MPPSGAEIVAMVGQALRGSFFHHLLFCPVSHHSAKGILAIISTVASVQMARGGTACLTVWIRTIDRNPDLQNTNKASDESPRFVCRNSCLISSGLIRKS